MRQGSQVPIQTCCSKITDPIQTYFWTKYRTFTDPVICEIQTYLTKCIIFHISKKLDIKGFIVNMYSFNFPIWHSMLNYKQECWLVMKVNNSNYFYHLTSNFLYLNRWLMKNINFTDHLIQIQTFYRPKSTKRSVLQTQVCKYRPIWEPWWDY